MLNLLILLKTERHVSVQNSCDKNASSENCPFNYRMRSYSQNRCILARSQRSQRAQSLLIFLAIEALVRV